MLINLLELASPLYINIVYTSVLPSGSMSSLVVMTVVAIVVVGGGGWYVLGDGSVHVCVCMCVYVCV